MNPQNMYDILMSQGGNGGGMPMGPFGQPQQGLNIQNLMAVLQGQGGNMGGNMGGNVQGQPFTKPMIGATPVGPDGQAAVNYPAFIPGFSGPAGQSGGQPPPQMPQLAPRYQQMLDSGRNMDYLMAQMGQFAAMNPDSPVAQQYAQMQAYQQAGGGSPQQAGPQGGYGQSAPDWRQSARGSSIQNYMNPAMPPAQYAPTGPDNTRGGPAQPQGQDASRGGQGAPQGPAPAAPPPGAGFGRPAPAMPAAPAGPRYGGYGVSGQAVANAGGIRNYMNPSAPGPAMPPMTQTPPINGGGVKPEIKGDGSTQTPPINPPQTGRYASGKMAAADRPNKNPNQLTLDHRIARADNRGNAAKVDRLKKKKAALPGAGKTKPTISAK